MATTASAQDLDTLSAADVLPLGQAEGRLTVHAITRRIGRVEEAFEAAYPCVDMIGFDMTSTEMIARLQNEAAAQIGNADVIYVCNAPVVPTDLIAPYVPPRVADALPDTAKPRLLRQRQSWPHMTVAANIDRPLKMSDLSRHDRRIRVAKALAVPGVAPLSARYPGEISGGQQQRVAVARMIAPRPRVLLFDEPLSNLDTTPRVERRIELLRVHRATGAVARYVTHDQIEAMTMATHVAVMNGSRIAQFDTPDRPLSKSRNGFRRAVHRHAPREPDPGGSV